MGTTLWLMASVAIAAQLGGGWGNAQVESLEASAVAVYVGPDDRVWTQVRAPDPTQRMTAEQVRAELTAAVTSPAPRVHFRPLLFEASGRVWAASWDRLFGASPGGDVVEHKASLCDTGTPPNHGLQGRQGANVQSGGVLYFNCHDRVVTYDGRRFKTLQLGDLPGRHDSKRLRQAAYGRVVMLVEPDDSGVLVLFLSGRQALWRHTAGGSKKGKRRWIYQPLPRRLFSGHVPVMGLWPRSPTPGAEPLSAEQMSAVPLSAEPLSAETSTLVVGGPRTHPGIVTLRDRVPPPPKVGGRVRRLMKKLKRNKLSSEQVALKLHKMGPKAIEQARQYQENVDPNHYAFAGEVQAAIPPEFGPEATFELGPYRIRGLMGWYQDGKGRVLVGAQAVTCPDGVTSPGTVARRADGTTRFFHAETLFPIWHNGTNTNYGGWVTERDGRHVWFSGGQYSFAGQVYKHGPTRVDLETMKVVARQPNTDYTQTVAITADGTLIVGPWYGFRDDVARPLVRYKPAEAKRLPEQ